DLQAKLLDGYKCPVVPPSSVSEPSSLTDLEIHSLKHYIAWKKSNGTVKAYELHAQVLQQATQLDILSLYAVCKLAGSLAKVEPVKIDMCPRSCIAYTGDFKDLKPCPHTIKGRIACGEKRYTAGSKPKPRAQMPYVSFISIIQAMFANKQSSQLLRYRDRYLQETLKLLAVGSQSSGVQAQARYSDFPSGSVHEHHYKNMGLFQDERDIAFALSTDGAQLTMKKQSDTWILILILLNLPPESRYLSNNIILTMAIPGPQSPGNIESFV
ncbi:hypothetical protein SERLA73DRAFT_23872, partial [Serpula lacrymans var. lacrymans S7.3]